MLNLQKEIAAHTHKSSAAVSEGAPDRKGSTAPRPAVPSPGVCSPELQNPMPREDAQMTTPRTFVPSCGYVYSLRAWLRATLACAASHTRLSHTKLSSTSLYLGFPEVKPRWVHVLFYSLPNTHWTEASISFLWPPDSAELRQLFHWPITISRKLPY